MIRTILLGTCVQVQGIFEKMEADGRMVVRVGNWLFAGFPANPLKK